MIKIVQHIIRHIPCDHAVLKDKNDGILPFGKIKIRMGEQV